MTNAEIIFNNRVFLMEQDVIKGIPGMLITVSDDSGDREIMMPEEIHTFEEWKKMGYQVQKGQKAVAKFQIWMPKKNKKKADSEDGAEEKEEAKGFYKKVAFFFTQEQTKKIEEA